MMKNNKKKGILIAVAVAVIVVIAVAAVCLNRKTDNAGAVSEGRTESADKTKKSDKADKEESETKRNSDAQVITFAVPDICKIDKNNLKKFNDALAADGHDYELEIKTLSYDNYGQAVEGALENGKTDIAFLGFGDAAGNNPVYDLVRSDLVLNLDDILSGDKGKTLYEAFPKNLWEMVKCDKHIYSIPLALASDEGVYAAFNRDYVSDDAISAWDGSIDGIYHRNSCRESEVYCHRKSARIPPKAGKTQRHSETKRKNQTVRYSLYLGQAGTAMYQTGHRANLRSEIQRQQLRLSPEPFRGTRRVENLHHASTHEPALCD